MQDDKKPETKAPSTEKPKAPAAPMNPRHRRPAIRSLTAKQLQAEAAAAKAKGSRK